MFLDSDNFSVRLKYFMKKKKITALSIAQEIGVTKSAVTNWSNGIRFPKDEKRLIKISKILNINFIDLFANSNSNRKEITIDELKNNFGNYIDYIPNLTLPSNLKKITFNHGYPSANMIIMENNMQNAEHIFVDKLMLSKEYQDQELKAVIMLGDAMSPYLEHGDVAIYCPSNSYTVKGKYVINSTDGLEVVSIEKLKKCGSLVLRPDNPTYSTETFAKEEQDLIEFVGMVVGRVSKS